MARLRVRIELSRGGLGVPLQKLSSVISEAQKFLHLVTEDVHVDKQKGEWLVFDFDRESLDFTAEYIGPVTSRQVEAFNAAFDGTTPLRRATIAQFARITDGIGEDEIIGFGLFQSDDMAEPSEWRCLSRRDALRIAEEIQLLLGVSQELDLESRLPSVRDPGLGARIFGDRRERGRGGDYSREVESSLSNRIARVEKTIEQQSSKIQDLHHQAASTDESLRTLLSTIDDFCRQASRQLDRITPAPSAPALAAPPAAAPVSAFRWWRPASATLTIASIVLLSLWLWPVSSIPASATKSAAASPPIQYQPSPSPPPPAAPRAQPSVMRIDIDATAPAWVSMMDTGGNKLLNQLQVPGAPRTINLITSGTLRTGNAAGLVVRLNGQPIGPIGAPGQVRDIQFKDGDFKITSPK
ncbi:MAG TPA: DUF4115 domain-containing protein [Bryobacteraceae bacterium]|nr:DUF4115 domain-containing protein [Bryobacteraceae bacterium]